MRIDFLIGLLSGALVFANAETKYENDFQKAEVGSIPEDLLVLAGDFVVREDNGNRFLELPGDPLDTCTVLFGPQAKENLAASARIFGTAKGRRFPVFDLSVNGGGGYKLRVSPLKKRLEIFRGDSLLTGVALEKWETGKWTHLRLQVIKAGENQWKIDGKVWQEGASEPNQPTVSFSDTEAPPSGRAGVTGMPYSGTPIRFDDFKVESAK